MTWLEHRVPPPVVALLMAGLAWGLAQWLPAWPWNSTVRWPLVLILAVALGPGLAGFSAAR